ncbi:unnamed protein product, partial [Amoebophrya sp. A25]
EPFVPRLSQTGRYPDRVRRHFAGAFRSLSVSPKNKTSSPAHNQNKPVATTSMTVDEHETALQEATKTGNSNEVDQLATPAHFDEDVGSQHGFSSRSPMLIKDDQVLEAQMPLVESHADQQD